MAFNPGVPCQLIKEFLNRKISIEASSGDVYKGILTEFEDNMNVTLSGVSATMVNGTKVKIESLYLKGCRIRIIILPETAIDSVASLNRAARGRGRGGFIRGGRGARGGRRSSGGSKSSYDHRRY